MDQNPNLKDKIDERIVFFIEENKENGVRLTEVANEIGFTVTGARLRLLELERLGVIRLERGHNRLTAFPREEVPA